MHIKASGLSKACQIIVDEQNITATSIKIGWALDSESAVTEYEIECAKWRKIGKRKVQKNKKHKKKKKRKRKYDSSSDDSMSTAQSESESDSDDSKSDEVNGDEKEREEIDNAMIDVNALKFERIGFKNTDKILKKNSFKLKKLSR